jgi:2-polyprenyl-6-methoxyphenol hydroxylase-like FAD-dependent oxidoreductase
LSARGAGALNAADADVAVIGAGPAGAAAAIALAAHCRVVLLERNAAGEDRIGETLPAAARRHLDALGLWPDFAAAGHAPCGARRTVWGGPGRVDQAGAGSDGFGWQIDRAAFENQLRTRLVDAGGSLLAPVGITCMNRDASGWTIEVVGRGYSEPLKLRARLVIDAGGRASRSLRPFGQTRLAEDRLVCAWIHAPLVSEPDQLRHVESDRDGWWSTAPLPGGRRLISFLTDSDLPVTGQMLEGGLVERVRLSASLSEATADADLNRVTPVRFCAAHGTRLDTAAGDGWLAVGDAALCLDPLASHGLLTALDTAAAGAAAARRLLDRDVEAGAAYDADVARLWRACRQERDAFYALEQRWPESPFWRRRLPGA